MQKFEFPYEEYRFNKLTGLGSAVSLKRSFYSASKPKEMSLKEYQNMLLAIVDMPLFARVLCGFVKADTVAIDFKEERFNFNKCNSEDLLTLYNSIEKFLLTILFKTKDDVQTEKENLLPIELSNLDFLRDYITDNNCENYNYKIHSLLCQIIANTFLAVSNVSFYQNKNIEGKNIFEVGSRKFFLPVAAIMDLSNKKAAEYVLGKDEFEKAINEVSQNQFTPYSTWNATTAIHFYTFSQNFDLIHNGEPISIEQLNEGQKIAFKNSVAAIFATLSREIESISADGKINFVKTKKEMTLKELENDTNEKITFFNTHLTMDEAHQCNFFFANTISPTNNTIILPTNNQRQQRGKKQPQKRQK